MTQNATTGNYEPFEAKDWKIGIVVADFNKDITSALVDSALARSKAYNTAEPTVVHVAGAVEIPLVLEQMAKTGIYDVLMAIGCVIKGETPHFDYVCKFVTDGVLRVQLDNAMPVALGVLTCNTKEEAQARMALGSDHLDAVMHQLRVLREIRP